MSARSHCYPDWVVLHLPHDSARIPEDVRGQFLLSDEELYQELVRLTDHYTAALFKARELSAQYVRSDVSRLVVDVERFANDELEMMAQKGMGAIYDRTSSGDPLRRPLSLSESRDLLRGHYEPHHRQLDRAVQRMLEKRNCALVLDCHSFPSIPLPHESSQAVPRPDICLGTDDFHTPPQLLNVFKAHFEEAGFSVAVNSPFSGALVPASAYRTARNVYGIMIEVNRGLYIDETHAKPLAHFDRMSDRIAGCIQASLERAEKLFAEAST